MKCKKKSEFKIFDDVDHIEECQEESMPGSDYCILHTEYPNEGSPDYNRIDELKKEKIKEKIDNNDFIFVGAIFKEIKIINKEVRCIVFTNSKFDDVHIENVKITNHLNADIDCTNISGGMFYLRNVDIENRLVLSNANLSEILLNQVKIGSWALINNVTTSSFTNLIKVSVGEDIIFTDSVLSKTIHFDFSNIKGRLNLKGTKIELPEDQEIAYRLAKNNSEKNGDKIDGDYYFYKEMEAKRLQKPLYFRIPEWFIQKFFGYGVYPERLMGTFILSFILFALIYWQINGILIDKSINFASLQISLKLSFLTLLIPAYGIVVQTNANYGIYIIIEAVLGVLLWPLFIATFARKFMR